MKAAPKERINLSGALLKDEMRPPEKRRAAGVLAALLIAVAMASGIAWYFLHKKGAQVAAPAAPSAAVSAVPAVSPPVPQPVPPPAVEAVQSSAQPVVSPAPPAATPVPPSSAVSSPPTAAPVPSKPSVATAAPTSEEDEEARPRRKNRASRNVAAAPPQSAETASPAASAAPSVAPPANIRVSGIAWQEERSLRRAVVNDFLMKEGSLVSGAKITEILRDRVRFSLSGGTFEVLLLSSPAAGAGK